MDETAAGTLDRAATDSGGGRQRVSEIAPGWYKDPADPTTQRYWDGEVWIGDPLPADATPPDGPPAGAASVPVREPERPRVDAASGSPYGANGGTQSAAASAETDRPGRSTTGWSPPPGWPTPPGTAQPGSPQGWMPPEPGQPGAGQPGAGQPNGDQPGADQAGGHPSGWPPSTPPDVPPGAPPNLPPGWPPIGPPQQGPPQQGPPQSGSPPQGSPPQGSPPQNWPPAGSPPQNWPPQNWPGVRLPPGVRVPPNGQIDNPPPGWPAGAGYPYVVVVPRPHGMALASLGRRFAARVIDIVAVAVLSAILTGYLIYQWWQETSGYWQQTWHIMQAAFKGASVPDVTPTMTSRGSWLSVAILLLVMGIWLVYEVPNIASSGQTPGKRLMGIRVVGLEATTPIGVRRALRRWMPLGLPILVWTCGPLGFLFGGILQLVNCLSPTINRPLRLALHDRRAFTVVVQSGTGPDVDHPDSGSMAHSTAAAPPGGDGRNDSPNGGSR
jgi:uncharacterized RDD family membrane protein YckC